jgi:hypothetical protein
LEAIIVDEKDVIRRLIQYMLPSKRISDEEAGRIVEKWVKWKFPATYYQIMVGGLEIDLEKDNN